MKRVLSIVLLLVTVFTAGCSRYNADETADSSAASDTEISGAVIPQDGTSEDTALPDGNNTLLTDKLTLMVYMVGSDLESKAGAGTDDLNEIAESGIDLGAANVLVCAAGTTIWHNEVTSVDYLNFLKLGDSGFETIKTDVSASMGAADTLTAFVNYCTENCKTEKYALVLWDHGNGPVMGYGKDILYDKDMLTLPEMKEAMSKTAFGPSNKLMFVGFDACLMASAELACIWGDYAEYLVASQEVEPSFGWDYSFLSSIGSSTVLELTDTLMGAYLEKCEQYYKKRKYENCDTTMSCLDLSYAKELEEAVDALFAKASAKIDKDYDAVAAPRVSARSFGRASTGSEYDLVDLGDLAQQYASVFPEESKRLTEVISKLVVGQRNNSERCSGLSIYYPFYNKYYYENGWAEAYKKLEIFNSYVSFLQKYDRIWLKGDEELGDYATSEDPERSDIEGRFTYKLTEEQAKRYANARYYILRSDGGDRYHSVYMSSNLTYDNGTLTANFNGNIIYVKSGDQKSVPPIEETDSVNGITRYQIKRVSLSTFDYNPDETYARIDDKINCKINLAADSINNTVSISSVVPREINEKSGEIYSGKEEDIDIFQWDEIFIRIGSSNILTRNENGYVEAYDNWFNDGGIYASEMYIANGLEFIYAPLDDDNYSLIFEIEDTQGNKYCSNPIPLKAPDQEEETVSEKEPDIIEWKTRENLTIYDKNGVTIRLATGTAGGTLSGSKIPYYFIIDNKNNFPVYIDMRNIVINDTIDSGSYYMGAIPANVSGYYDREHISISFINLGYAFDCGAITDVNSFQFCFEIRRSDNYYIMEKDASVKVILNEKTSYNVLELYNKETYTISKCIYPFRGLMAEEQVLYSADDVRITLLKFGAHNDRADCSGYAYFKIENSGNKPKYVSIPLIYMDGVIVSGSNFGYDLIAYPGKTAYYEKVINYSDANKLNITSAASLCYAFMIANDYDSLRTGSVPLLRTEVNLSQKGEPHVFEEGTNVVYDKDGIKLILNNSYYKDNYYYWQYCFINGTDNDITLSTRNGSLVYVGSDPYIGAHQKANITVSRKIAEDESLPDQFDETIYLLNFFETKYLGVIDMTFKVSNKETAQIKWSTGDTCTLYEEKGIALKIVRSQTGYQDSYRNSETTHLYLSYANNTDFPITFTFSNIIINGKIYGKEINSVSAEAGASDRQLDRYNHEYFIDLGSALLSGELSLVNDIEFGFDIYNRNTGEIISGNNRVKLTLPESISQEINELYKNYDPYYSYSNPARAEDCIYPFRDMTAGQQVVYSSGGLKVTLLKFGADKNKSAANGYAYFRLEKKGYEETEFDIDYISVGGQTYDVYFHGDTTYKKLKPGTVTYGYLYIDPDKIDKSAVSPDSFKLGIKVNKGQYSSDETLIWKDVKLSSKGTGDPHEIGVETLCHENGVKFNFVESYVSRETFKYYWKYELINETAENIYYTYYFERDYRIHYDNYEFIGPGLKKIILMEVSKDDVSVGDELHAYIRVTDSTKRSTLCKIDVLLKTLQ